MLFVMNVIRHLQDLNSGSFSMSLGSLIVGSLEQIFQKEGLRGMYRGLSPTVLALLPNWAVSSLSFPGYYFIPMFVCKGLRMLLTWYSCKGIVCFITPGVDIIPNINVQKNKERRFFGFVNCEVLSSFVIIKLERLFGKMRRGFFFFLNWEVGIMKLDSLAFSCDVFMKRK